MITTQHNDGTCFKMIIKYSRPYDDDEREVILYGEDQRECFNHWEHNFGDFYTREIHIIDDSK